MSGEPPCIVRRLRRSGEDTGLYESQGGLPREEREYSAYASDGGAANRWVHMHLRGEQPEVK